LPKEFSFVDPKSDTQSVHKGRSELGSVSWRVKVSKDAAGKYKVTATSAGAKASLDVIVRKKFSNTIFGGAN
jgi:hypothetical protein